MNLKNILSHLPKGYWLNSTHELFELTENFTATKNEFKYIVENIKKYVEKRTVGRAINWLALALIVDQEKTINYIVRDSIFKITKFDYDFLFLHKIIEAICNNALELRLNDKIAKYFNSKHNFLYAAKEIKAIYYSIKQTVIKNKLTIFKDLLVISDLLFLKEFEKQQNENPNKIDFYTKEEIAESISFILFTFFKTQKVNPQCLNRIDEKKIINDEYLDVIVASCVLKKYLEIEVKIDSFGYECYKDGTSIHITDADSFLEKSIQHGWIYTFIQKSNFSLRTIREYKNDALSLEDFCNKIYDELGDVILKRRTEPIERLILEIPTYPPLFEFLKKDHFFLEEILILSDECREMFKGVNDLLNFEVVSNLTFRDILYVHRLFNFFRYIFSKYLEKHIVDDPKIVFRSLLPVYGKDNLLEILEILIGKEKAGLYLDLFSWNSKKNTLFDIQYRPIINIDEHYIVPLNAMCKSDVFRNTLYIIRKRLFDNSNIDPIAEILKNQITNKNFLVNTNVEFNYEIYNGDIDLIAKFGNTILIVEAKNTLLPGNIYELRTTYDNMIKAASQLTKIKQAFSKPSFAKYIAQKIGWEINENSHIITCIVLANRLFSGYRIDGHAVRSVFELAHFIEEGKILYQDGNTYLMWEGADISEKDIKNYLTDDVFHKLEYDIMSETVIQYPFKKLTYNDHSYVANYEHFSEKLKSTFKYFKTT